jgi:choline dehydrogenase-like flavoprotein
MEKSHLKFDSFCCVIALNMMVYMRGNRRDYDTWEQEFGATGWSWEEVSRRLFKMSKRLSASLRKRRADGFSGILCASLAYLFSYAPVVR